jgi:hypothetical protein
MEEIMILYDSFVKSCIEDQIPVRIVLLNGTLIDKIYLLKTSEKWLLCQYGIEKFLVRNSEIRTIGEMRGMK